MTIERDPHGYFAGAWLGWLACVTYALFRPDEPALGLVVLLAFLPIEAIAIWRGEGPRRTLSEMMTWLQRRLSKHTHVARGWNAMILMVILCICYLLGRTVWHYSGSWPLAVALGGLGAVWLQDHWVEVHKHG